MSPPRARGLAAEIGRFLRANLSSTAATGVDWLLVTVLTWGGIHYLASAAVGAAAGAITDFLMKRHWAFDRSAKGGLHAEGLRYLAVSGTSLGWNLLVAYALVDGLGLPAVPGVIAASVVVGAIWNYPLHRLFVFRHTLAPAVEPMPEPTLSPGESGGAAGARPPPRTAAGGGGR